METLLAHMTTRFLQKKYLLPLGILLAMVLGLLAPSVGLAVRGSIGTNPLVAIIFLLCGWEVDLNDCRFTRKTLAIFISGAFLALILSPWMASLLAHIMRLGEQATLGLIVISAVPPTLSSGIVFTKNALGNVFLAMTVTIGYNIMGVFTMPPMIAWCLSSCVELEISPLKLFLQMCLYIILPFAVGGSLKYLCRINCPKWMAHIPNICVILLLISFFADFRKMLLDSPASLLIASAFAGMLLHILQLAIIWYGGLLAGFTPEDRKAMLFTAGTKTLSVTLTVLAFLHADTGLAAVPCTVFYTVQMLLDSMLSAHMGKRA
ncbi:MAG: bile acid:sodium symporter [Victivallales bacterium]|nr:bile acid:sodium symporter [Victivallales bacterium]